MITLFLIQNKKLLCKIIHSKNKNFPYCSKIFIRIIIFIMSNKSWKKRINSSIKRFFTNRAVTYSVCLITVLFLLMYIIFITEKDNNSKINTFFDAFWYTLVTITTVGYGDITLQSFVGRFAGLILLLFGVVIFAAFSGKIASILFDKQLKKDRGLIQLKKIKNHFLICGWKPDFE